MKLDGIKAQFSEIGEFGFQINGTARFRAVGPSL